MVAICCFVRSLGLRMWSGRQYPVTGKCSLVFNAVLYSKKLVKLANSRGGSRGGGALGG